VKFLIALADLNQPYSCSQWGNVPDGGASQIISDTGYGIWDLFNYDSAFPTQLWLDHEMRVYDKLAIAGSWSIRGRIDQMLETCGCLCDDNTCYCGDGQCNGDDTADSCPEDCSDECIETVGNNACNFPDCNLFYDCAGECGGSSEIDECDVCGGGGPFLICSDGSIVCDHSECPNSCNVGYVMDCSGDDSCCPESWIGDGYADCEDQPWGCDLTCYDCDGGDCGTDCAYGETYGCIDQNACNYNQYATVDDGTCTYSVEGYNCDGDCILEMDCANECGGIAELDECGVCEGNGYADWECNDGESICWDKADGACDCNGNVEDCMGVCGGDAVVDECGVCNGPGYNADGCCGELTTDCAGSCGGSAWESDCGCVAEGNSGDDCDDCAGVANGDSVVDNCGTCDIDSSNDCVQDCADTWGGNLVYDECGICGGDGVDADDDGVCDDVDDCVIEEGTSQACGCNTGPSGCDETCGSTLELDECGVCDGDGQPCIDSDGDGLGDENDCEPQIISSWATGDSCSIGYLSIFLYSLNEFICDEDCDGVQTEFDCDFSNSIASVEDECGVCGGDNSTCTGCMDDAACNFNDCNGDEVLGDPCTIEDNQLCSYPEEVYLNCDGSCINDSDGDGVCDELSLFNGLIPEDFSIHSIYPNPFNPVTSITYGLPEHANVQIVVYDLSGQQVETLMNDFQTPGYHSVNWNADKLPSGVYLIRIDSEDFTQTQKVVLVK